MTASIRKRRAAQTIAIFCAGAAALSADRDRPSSHFRALCQNVSDVAERIGVDPPDENLPPGKTL